MFKYIAEVNSNRKASSTLTYTKEPGTKRFKELDTLRGFAALYVMFFHLSGVAGLQTGFLSAGVTGVDLFFIISGYVIFMSLEKTRTAGDFIISRITRLFPSYIVMMGITLLIIFVFNKPGAPSFTTILFNSTMLQPWFLVPYIDDSYWTLFVEVLFYGSILVLFALNQLKNIIAIGCTILLVIFLYYYSSSTWFAASKYYIIPRNFFPLVSHFQLFFAGIVFYKARTFKSKWLTHLIIACCYGLTLFIFNKAGRAHFFINIEVYAFCVFMYFTIFYLFVYNKLTFLNTRALVFIGSISYGIYLLHQQAAIVVYPYLVTNFHISPFAAVWLLAVFIIAMATLVTYRIERPIVKFIHKKFVQPVFP